MSVGLESPAEAFPFTSLGKAVLHTPGLSSLGPPELQLLPCPSAKETGAQPALIWEVCIQLASSSPLWVYVYF